MSGRNKELSTIPERQEHEALLINQSNNSYYTHDGSLNNKEKNTKNSNKYFYLKLVLGYLPALAIGLVAINKLISQKSVAKDLYQLSIEASLAAFNLTFVFENGIPIETCGDAFKGSELLSCRYPLNPNMEPANLKTCIESLIDYCQDKNGLNNELRPYDAGVITIGTGLALLLSLIIGVIIYKEISKNTLKKDEEKPTGTITTVPSNKKPSKPWFWSLPVLANDTQDALQPKESLDYKQNL
ncbi:MAG: hypothetical protein QM652_13885 [Legionella sp.]|uniref:hypothetical protein n=1 Tax=Legionella sp. TaxID=459 RepID=UPI0039E530C4